MSFFTSPPPAATAAAPTTLWGQPTTPAPSSVPPQQQQQPQQPPPPQSPALQVPDYDTVFHGKLWNDIAALADAVWTNYNSHSHSNNNQSHQSQQQQQQRPTSLSWEAQELQAKIVQHQDLWVTEACDSVSVLLGGGGGGGGGHHQQAPPSTPWQVPPHQRQHYVDHPDQFPDVEIPIADAGTTTAGAGTAANEDGSGGATVPPTTSGRRRTRLNRTLLEQMFQLCHELHVGEDVALCLLMRVVSTQPQQSNQTPATTVAACRQLYFHEKCSALSALLRIVQYRLECPDVVAVTDSLLVHDLVPQLLVSIREHTKISMDLRKRYHDERDVAAAAAPDASSPVSPSASSSNVTVLQWHLRYHAAQRQAACRVLFYVAYKTQLTAGEVASIVDVIHDLSQHLDVLDPVDDVPSPCVEEAGHSSSSQQSQTTSGGTWNYPFSPPTPTTRATPKSEVQWHHELVDAVHESSLPDLLRAVSTLIMTALCALESQAVLTDRHTHADNPFGQGNALAPPDATPQDLHNLLGPLHARLNRDAAAQWSRPDILGVLLASYALLLRSSAVATAPPSPSGGLSTSVDLRKAWRECLEAPAELKSFTFARMGLVPALLSAGTDPTEHDILGRGDGRLTRDKSVCDTAEFLVAVLARFASGYLTVLSAYGDLPISRVKWEQDAEATLALRRTQREEQRTFQEWSNTNDVVDGAADVIPTSVDLAQRPDCMDDVIAFASAVASIGPDCAAMFWSYVEPDPGNGEIRLAPSLALQAMDRQQEDDESLLPCYLTFLSALALADGGATAVHKLLVAPLEEGRNGQVSWGSIMRILQWYSQKLGKDEFGGSPGMKAAATLHTSTSYYYAYEDSTDGGSDTTWVGTNAEHRRPVQESTDLSESSAFILMSHLRFVSSICWRCPAARYTLLGTFQGSGLSGSAAPFDQDSTLVILFSLAVAPLPPDLRGEVFTALASVLTADPSNEGPSEVQASAMTAWQILDQCQILPIYLLDQYPSSFEKSSKNYVGLRFPPSSMALAAETRGRTWIPPESMYSIIYEFEYIESSKGIYRSTEGFLRLLRALFRTAGASHDLGSSWRARTGCTPYIEYVARFVLPRATGVFHGSAPLPFRSSQDRDRLVALSLEIVTEVASDYLVFPPSKIIPEAIQPPEVAEKRRQLYEDSLEAHGMRSLLSSVVTEPSTQDARQFMLDWTSSYPPDRTSVDAQPTSATFEDPSSSFPLRRTLGSSSPRPKSASLSVLVDLLHESGGILFRSIVQVISRSASRRAADGDSDRSTLAFALFNATRPNLASLRHSSTFAPPRSSQRVISQLVDDTEMLCSSSAANWGERALLAALKTLCAALVREEQLLEASNSPSGTGSIVPVLSFRNRRQGVSHPEVSTVKLTRLSQLLLSSNVDSRVLCRLINLVGFVSTNEVRDVLIAQASTLIVLYVKQSLSFPSSLLTLYSVKEEGETETAMAFGTRLSVSGGRVHSEGDVDIVRAILTHLLRDLRNVVLHSESTSLSLLGFRSSSIEAWTSYAHHEANCFSALLYVLNDDEFHLSPFTANLAPTAFEVLARLITPKGGDVEEASVRIQHTAARLRFVDFWNRHLSKIIRHIEAGDLVPRDDLMHSCAWLLKSLSVEVDLLSGNLIGNPQFGQLERVASYVYAPPSDLLSKLIRLIPLQRLEAEGAAVKPSENVLTLVTAPMSGPPEVVDGFQVIRLDKLRKVAGFREKPNAAEMEAWCQCWNASVHRDCSTAHLSSAIYQFLGSTLVSESALNSRQPTIRVGLGGLLTELLSRLSDSDFNSCFALATRNLALAALVVSREFVHDSEDSRTAELFDGALIRSLAVNSVISSGVRVDVHVADRLHLERTALLGTVLSTLLEDAGSIDLEGQAPAFIDAAVVLASLSLDVTSSSGSFAAPTNLAAIARVCLGVLFDKLHDTSASSGRQSFTQKVLFSPYGGETVMMSYMRLVRSLDWNLTRLLLSISTRSVGCQLLLDVGVVDAIVEASGRYHDEESRALSSTVGTLEVEVPPFFSGHLELLVSLLMNAVEVDQNSMVSKCVRILMNYERILDRIACQFPRSLSLVQQIVRLYVAVAHMSRRPNASHLMSKALESKYLALAFKLACFPLPDTFLPALPESLRGPAKRHTPVTFSSDAERSWWASMAVNGGFANDSIDQVVAYALDGAEVAKDLIWSFLSTPTITATIDSRQISRCLCRCCDALQVMERSAMGFGTIRADPAVLTSEEALKLRSIWWDIAFEALNLLLGRVRHHGKRSISIHQPIDVPYESVDEMKYVICVALDHCSFDLATSWSSSAAGSQRDVVADLARTLRRETERLL